MSISLAMDSRTRRAIIMLLVTELFWGMGSFFVLPTTTVPAYLATLGVHPIVLGVMFVAMGALPLAPQLFGRAVIERFSHRKRGVIILHFIAILQYLLIPWVDYLLDGRHNALLAFLVILLLSLAQIALGVVIPVWLDMVAQVVPETARGRYFGIAAGFLAIGGIMGSLALGGLHQWLGDAVYRGAFLATAVCFSIGMVFFAYAPISEATFAHPPEPSLGSRLRKALSACHPRDNFGRFIISNSLQTAAVAILPFLVIFATDAQGLHLPGDTFITLTKLQAVGGGVGALALGWIVDHTGSRRPWIAMTLLIPVILLLFPFGGYFPILVFCALLVGILNSGWSVSVPALLALSPGGDKSGYIAIANLIGFPGAVIAPMLLGGIIGGSGYYRAFLLAGIFGVLACIGALTIRERARSERDTEQRPAVLQE